MIAQTTSPLQVMVNKEMTDHIKSRRFLILLGLLILIFAGTLYLALTRIKDVPVENDANFVILKLFSLSDGTLPTFHVFLNFLGPLLGIAMGFDAINGEWNKEHSFGSWLNLCIGTICSWQSSLVLFRFWRCFSLASV